VQRGPRDLSLGVLCCDSHGLCWDVQFGSSISRVLPSQAHPAPTHRALLGSVCVSHLLTQTHKFNWGKAINEEIPSSFGGTLWITLPPLLSISPWRSLSFQKARVRKKSEVDSALDLQCSPQETGRKKAQPSAWDQKGNNVLEQNSINISISYPCTPTPASGHQIPWGQKSDTLIHTHHPQSRGTHTYKQVLTCTHVYRNNKPTQTTGMRMKTSIQSYACLILTTHIPHIQEIHTKRFTGLYNIHAYTHTHTQAWK